MSLAFHEDGEGFEFSTVDIAAFVERAFDFRNTVTAVPVAQVGHFRGTGSDDAAQLSDDSSSLGAFDNIDDVEMMCVELDENSILGEDTNMASIDELFEVWRDVENNDAMEFDGAVGDAVNDSASFGSNDNSEREEAAGLLFHLAAQVSSAHLHQVNVNRECRLLLPTNVLQKNLEACAQAYSKKKDIRIQHTLTDSCFANFLGGQSDEIHLDYICSLLLNFSSSGRGLTCDTAQENTLFVKSAVERFLAALNVMADGQCIFSDYCYFKNRVLKFHFSMSVCIEFAFILLRGCFVGPDASIMGDLSTTNDSVCDFERSSGWGHDSLVNIVMGAPNRRMSMFIIGYIFMIVHGNTPEENQEQRKHLYRLLASQKTSTYELYDEIQEREYLDSHKLQEFLGRYNDERVAGMLGRVDNDYIRLPEKLEEIPRRLAICIWHVGHMVKTELRGCPMRIARPPKATRKKRKGSSTIEVDQGEDDDTGETAETSEYSSEAVSDVSCDELEKICQEMCTRYFYCETGRSQQRALSESVLIQRGEALGALFQGWLTGNSTEDEGLRDVYEHFLSSYVRGHHGSG